MIWLICGATHTGKTVLAQRILEEKRAPYLSLDHLKMGLIRSGRVSVTAVARGGRSRTRCGQWRARWCEPAWRTGRA